MRSQCTRDTQAKPIARKIKFDSLLFHSSEEFIFQVHRTLHLTYDPVKNDLSSVFYTSQKAKRVYPVKAKIKKIYFILAGVVYVCELCVQLPIQKNSERERETEREGTEVKSTRRNAQHEYRESTSMLFMNLVFCKRCKKKKKIPKKEGNLITLVSLIRLLQSWNRNEKPFSSAHWLSILYES